MNKSLDHEIQEEFRAIRDGSRKVMSKTCQKYLAALVSPRTSPKVGVPTLLGGSIGKTKIVTTKAVGKFECGAGGWGFVKLSNPGLSTVNATLPVKTVGPFGGVGGPPCGSFSTSAWGGSSLAQSDSGVVAGITEFVWISNYTTANSRAGFQYRLVGMSIEVFPESSFSTQNGALALYEFSGHLDATRDATLLLSTIEGFESTRNIRATQTGSLTEKIVINWHPRCSASDSNHAGFPVIETKNDFAFTNGTAVGYQATQLPSDGLIVIAEGAPNTQFHYTCSAIWELRGSAVDGKKPRLVDSRGMDLVMNTIAAKRQDGYVGRPEAVKESYMGHALHVANQLGITRQGVASAALGAIKTIGGFI